MDQNEEVHQKLYQACDICQMPRYTRTPAYVPLVLTDNPDKPFGLVHCDLFYFDSKYYLTIDSWFLF